MAVVEVAAFDKWIAMVHFARTVGDCWWFPNMVKTACGAVQSDCTVVN